MDIDKSKVWSKRERPIAKGCLIKIKIKDKEKDKKQKIIVMITEISLIKI